MLKSKFSELKTKFKQIIKDGNLSVWLLVMAAITFVSAIVLGFGTRIVAVFQYSDYTEDMARGLYVYQEMWAGNWPTLGEPSSVGLFRLSPLFYYLIWPFTALGPEPIWPGLASAIFSFGSIILLAILVYQLLDHTSRDRRLFFSSLASLWWSILYVDVLLANRAWNPSPINFFLFSLLLIWNCLWRQREEKKLKTSLWILYGLVFSLLISMHASALFVLPFFYLATLTAYYFHKKSWQGPALSLLTTGILCLPYVLGEIQRGWTNTQKFFQVMLGEAEGNSLANIFDRFFFSFFETGRLVYFLHPSFFAFSGFFLVIVLTLSLLSFKGNRNLYFSLGFIYLAFFLIAANFQGYLLLHYITLVWSFPLILTITSLAYFSHSQKPIKIGALIFLSLGLSLSFWLNLLNIRVYLSSKFGPVQMVTAKDMAGAIEAIPHNSGVCVDGAIINNYRYLDDYVVKRNLSWHPFDNCQESQYYLLRDFVPNYSFFRSSDFYKDRIHGYYHFVHAGPTAPSLEDPDWQLWKETSLHRIYVRR